MTIDLLPASPNGEITHNDARLKTNEVATFLNDNLNLDDRYSIKPIDGGVGSLPNALGLYEAVSGVESLVGALGNAYTSQIVFTKGLGGLRFFNGSDGFEYFISRRDVSGDALGATFGNPDGSNYFSTKETGGLTVYHQTNTITSQQLGNAGSVAYIDSDSFSFQVTSDQARPYGALVLSFTGETDVDFADVPFDTRILDSTGTIVYSDIQNSEVWGVDPQPPSNPRFKLSSNAGVVILPAAQPFPMDDGTTYTVEYRFKQAIRLKGDGAQPALLMEGKRLEYYPINYTAEVGIETSDFTVISGGNYKVDTSGGAVVATVHPTVKSATFGDFASTWTGANDLTVSTDIGDIIFNNNENGASYQIIRNGAEWRIYNADGSLHEVTP